MANLELQSRNTFNETTDEEGFGEPLFKSEISDLSHHFLSSLQFYSFSPVTDKPIRVYNNYQFPATLIDNIFANTILEQSVNSLGFELTFQSFLPG